jgi:hypothetical protein
MAFDLDKDQWEKARKWMDEKKVAYTGAIGGQFTFSFFPTTLGCVCKVTDEVSKEVLDVSDYESW